MLSSVIQRVKNGWHEVRTVCWMKWRFSVQWNVRLLRSMSDSMFQPLHSVVTTNKIRGVFKKRPNFLNSAPTGTEGALRLLSAPSGKFWLRVWLARYFKCSVFFWTHLVYIERCGALSFAMSTVLAVRRRALLRNLLTAVCRIFIEFRASFCYIMLLYRTLVTCSATENKTPGLQYQYNPTKSVTRTFLAKG